MAAANRITGPDTRWVLVAREFDMKRKKSVEGKTKYKNSGARLFVPGANTTLAKSGDQGGPVSHSTQGFSV